MITDTDDEGQIRKMAADIAGIPIASLVRPTNAKPIDFEEFHSLFEAIIAFYTEIKISNLRAIVDTKLPTMKDHAAIIIRSLMAIKLFDIGKGGDPNEMRVKLIAQLRNAWYQGYNYSVSDVALARISSAGFADGITLIKTTLNDFKAEWKIASENFTQQRSVDEGKLNQKLVEVDKAVTDAREDVGKVLAIARESTILNTVAAQAKEFENEAQDCLRNSSRWLLATIVVGIISVVVVWLILIKAIQPEATISPFDQFLQNSNSSTNGSTFNSQGATAIIIQEVAARIFIITLLYGAVVWCARNFFASRHNFTVNRHRRNAMQTFRAFVGGTKDPVTQDFILRQAAVCAFSPQQTGYLKDESLPTPAPSSQIMEMIRPPSN
jgi:hypothetical protein